jgi:hypothetical protein
MELHYDYCSGQLNEVETSMEKSVENYANKHQKVKIGITNNPQQRFEKFDKTRKWKGMIVKYFTQQLKRT